MLAWSPAARRLLLLVGGGLVLGLGLAWLASYIVERGVPQVTPLGSFALVSTSPDDGSNGAATGSIKLVFNRPADLASVIDHLTITPPAQGAFWSEGNIVRFAPAVPFPRGQEVTVALDAGVLSQDGSQRLEDGAEWTFQVRSPRAIFLTPSKPPHILMVSAAQAGRSPQAILPGDQSLTDFSVSPGGEQLALVEANDAGGHDIWTLEESAPDPIQRTQCGGDDCLDPVWLPDRTHVAFTRVGADGSSMVWVLPLAGGEPVRLLDDPQLQAKGPVWSSDGMQVAFFDLGNGTMRLHSFASDHDLSFHTLNGLVGSWSPDGTRMVASVLDISQESPVGTLYVINAATGEATPLPLDGLVDAGSPVWSPGNSWIAVSARRPGGGLARGIWIVHPDGSDLTPAADQTGIAFGGPAWNAWGDELLFQGASLESLDSSPDVYVWRSGEDTLQVIAQDAYAPDWLP
jgi:Tol biopolymer transport system component